MTQRYRTVVTAHSSRWSYELYSVLAQQIFDERQVMEPRTKNCKYSRHSLEVNTIKCFVCCCSSRRLLAWQLEELVHFCLLLRHRWVLQELRCIHHKTIGAIAESFPRLIMPGKEVNWRWIPKMTLKMTLQYSTWLWSLQAGLRCVSFNEIHCLPQLDRR